MGSAIPAFLFATAQQHINSSLAGILNAMTPIFTVLIAVIFTKLALSKNKYIGVFIGFIGAIAIIVGKMFQTGDGSVSFGSTQIQYVLMVVLATVLYGANINLIKNKLAKYNAFVIATTPLLYDIYCCHDYNGISRIGRILQSTLHNRSTNHLVLLRPSPYSARHSA